jgi:CheY-like chemotaxis protein
MNLNWVSALLIDPDAHSASLLSGMLDGFGLQKKVVVETGEAARTALGNELFDIIFCDAVLPDIPSAELIQSIRHMEGNPIRLIPIVVLTGYGRMATVAASRDAGANFVVKKPVNANIFYDRLSWVSKGGRQFVESPGYVGPDRRFKNAGLPGGVGRRASDLNGELGAPAEPNMSQDEIDAMLKPMKLDI